MRRKSRLWRVIEAAGCSPSETRRSSVLMLAGRAPLFSPRDLLQFPVVLYGDGTGYAWVRAYTLGENNVGVQDSILICFSGTPRVTFSPTSISVPKLGSQRINVTVSDENGNPLAPGTSITSSIEFSPPPSSGWAAQLSTNFPEGALDDFLTRGPGSTNFFMDVIDATAGGTPQQMAVVVKIVVDGPNGRLQTSISGYIGVP